MNTTIGMNIGMIIPGVKVGCSIGIRLWMNHLGFVFFTMGGGKAPSGEKNKAKVINLKPDANEATNLHPWDDHPNGPGPAGHCDDCIPMCSKKTWCHRDDWDDSCQ